MFQVTKSRFAPPSMIASASAPTASTLAARISSQPSRRGLSLVQNRSTVAITGTMNTGIGASR